MPRTKTWEAPQVITRVRNSLVHPKNDITDNKIYVETWYLLLWYVELIILKLCNYDGCYANRLEAGTMASSDVPWKQHTTIEIDTAFIPETHPIPEYYPNYQQNHDDFKNKRHQPGLR